MLHCLHPCKCCRLVRYKTSLVLRVKDPWCHGGRGSAPWARSWSREEKLRSCWLCVVVMARGVQQDEALLGISLTVCSLGRRWPPAWPAAGGVQVAHIRMGFVSGGVTIICLSFWGEILMTGDELRMNTVSSPLSSQSKECKSWLGRGKQSVETAWGMEAEECGKWWTYHSWGRQLRDGSDF